MAGAVEQEKIAELKKNLGNLPEELPDFKDDLYLLMWLKGSKLDVDKTVQRIQTSVEWRKRAGVYELDEVDFDPEIDAKIISKRDGVAKDGSPVISFSFGPTKMYSIFSEAEPEVWYKFWRKFTRTIERAMIAANRRRNAGKTAVTVDDVQGVYYIVDFDKCALMQYTSPRLVSFFAGVCKELVTYNPDIVRSVQFLNLPMLIVPAAKLMGKILSGPNLSVACYSGPEAIEKNVLPLIDRDQLLI